MKWTKLFTPDGVSTWVNEAFDAYVEHHPDGCWCITGGSGVNVTFPPELTPNEALAKVQELIAAHLQDQLNHVKAAPDVETQSSPVELIPGSNGKLGYWDGWLRMKPGRSHGVKTWMSSVYMNEATECNIHPWIPATDYHAVELGVPTGTSVAGIRWINRKPA